MRILLNEWAIWRKLVGVEPTRDALKGHAPDLKSGPSTGFILESFEKVDFSLRDFMYNPPG